jgi:predicted NBD/HSP70 family sugar kinase
MALHSTSHVRTANAVQLVHLLREHGAMSRADLVRASGLTKPTVMAIVRSLLEEKVAIESGTGPVANGGGRPGSLVAFNREARTAVAAQFGLQFELAHVTATGDVLTQNTFPNTADADRFLKLAVREIERLDARSLGAVALAVPGFIDHPRGTVTYPPFDWERVPLQAVLEDALHVPAGLISLPSAEVVGEVFAGVATDHDDAVVIFLAHGIGAGILSRGRLVVGAGGAVGELGHCPVGSGIECECGRIGCLETVAGGWAIAAAAGPHAGLAELEARDDPGVDAVLARAAEALGAAAAWLTNLLDPSIVILADTHYTAGADAFFAAVEAAARAHAVSSELQIVRGTPDARLRGTIQCALELLPPLLRPSRIAVHPREYGK